LKCRVASGAETDDKCVKGVGKEEGEDMSGIHIVLPETIVISTRPSEPTLLQIPGYEDKLNRANMAKKTILVLLQEVATLTVDASDVSHLLLDC
jgi:hypothetical protein